MMECKLFMFHDIYRLDLLESKYIKSGLGRGVKMKMKTVSLSGISLIDWIPKRCDRKKIVW